MILSFHPIFEGDNNIICAGRLPDDSDLTAIKKATCVILPQGCSKELYDMARQNAPQVFPNYDLRFKYPGKIGQIHLFQDKCVSHPQTQTFVTRHEYKKEFKDSMLPRGFSFPIVFKFNWGGEGDTVFLVNSRQALDEKLKLADRFEKSGQNGFMIQEYVPGGNRVLRVVIIGNTLISYWRVTKDNTRFGTSLRDNGFIDKISDPLLQKKAIHQAKDFCKQTGINLAGFDFLFSTTSPDIPLFLEINYFFGRRGLGGSERFYVLLVNEINNWINTHVKGLKLRS